MLRRRKTIADNLFDPDFCQKIFIRCLRSKSDHISGDVYQKNKAKKHGDNEEEGKIRLFKSRGQHLLTNPRVLDSIVRASNIKPDDTVLEIGPGTGNLTLNLLESAKNVVAIEIDSRMVEALRKRAAERGFADRLTWVLYLRLGCCCMLCFVGTSQQLREVLHNLEKSDRQLLIVNGDALRTEFPKFDLVVANIPYGISSPLLARLFYGVKQNPFRSATLLLQKEFARRLMATPGDPEFNKLAVNMNLVAEVEFIRDVSKRDFVPCPNVDSSVVKICPKSEIPSVDLEEWWAFTRTCFSKKNRTLGATLKQKRKLTELMKSSRFAQDRNDDDDDDGIGILRGGIVRVLESGGFSDKRPSKLSNDDLLCLLSMFNEAGVYFHDQESKPKGIRDAAYAAACDDFM
ncbi:hypothetical protein OROHE_000572 [Orobanche hederae]